MAKTHRGFLKICKRFVISLMLYSLSVVDFFDEFSHKLRLSRLTFTRTRTKIKLNQKHSTRTAVRCRIFLGRKLLVARINKSALTKLETVQMKIQKVLAMDYGKVGRRALKEFKEYVEEANEQALPDLLRG